jgi:hypothetical protein
MGDSERKGKRILFFTNSDYGQANVVLATAYSILQTAPEAELHIASFRALESAVKKVSKAITFHPIDGISQFEACYRPEVGVQEAYDLTPGVVNSARNILVIPGIMLPWSPDEYMSIYHDCVRILTQVKPDMVVVDPLFSPALTLCQERKIKEALNWIVLAPNTIKDFAIPLQPRLAMLWKYPM